MIDAAQIIRQSVATTPLGGASSSAVGTEERLAAPGQAMGFEVRVDADLPSGVWAVAAGKPEDGAFVIANSTADALPLSLAFSSGRVATCRLTDETHANEIVPLPDTLPAHAFLLVLTK